MLSISARSVLIFVSAFCKANNCANSAFTLYLLLKYLAVVMIVFIESIITHREAEVQGGVTGTEQWRSQRVDIACIVTRTLPLAVLTFISGGRRWIPF